MEEAESFEVMLDFTHDGFFCPGVFAHFLSHTQGNTQPYSQVHFRYCNSSPRGVWSDDSQRMNDPAEYHWADTLIITCQAHAFSFPPSIHTNTPLIHGGGVCAYRRRPCLLMLCCTGSARCAPANCFQCVFGGSKFWQQCRHTNTHRLDVFSAMRLSPNS